MFFYSADGYYKGRPRERELMKRVRRLFVLWPGKDNPEERQCLPYLPGHSLLPSPLVLQPSRTVIVIIKAGQGEESKQNKQLYVFPSRMSSYPPLLLFSQFILNPSYSPKNILDPSIKLVRGSAISASLKNTELQYRAGG